jgi:hypothetical protein
MKAKHIKYISKFVNMYHENSIHKAPLSSAVRKRRFLWRKFDGEGAGSSELSKCNVTEKWCGGRTCGHVGGLG